MISRLLAFLFLTALSTFTFGQTLAPLGSYEQLYLDVKQPKYVSLEKNACGEFDLTGIFVVRPGATIERSVTPDTSGLGNVVSYSCSGCSRTEGGRIALQSDTITFVANEGIDEILDEITITACNAAGDCSSPRTIRILTQREGRTIDRPAVTATPEEQITLPSPDDTFAAGAVCRSLEFCSEDYAGRGQVATFNADQDASNSVTYTAARYGGVDQVCVILCTQYGLCDTYRTPITVVRETVGLPFFDDFSSGGARPDEFLWQDVDVIVNRTFADRPPSLGVATFDALALDGQPYPVAQGGRGTDIRDYLTSAPLNTSGQMGANLSFYLQARGLGNRPERQDSFLVQFLTNGGNWETVLKVEGFPASFPGSTEIPFEPYTIPLAEDHLYDGFSFRFANKSGERGAVDMWHLDYVKLTTDAAGIATADVALVNEPGSILGPMTSIPLRHFKAADDNLVLPQLKLGLFNVNSQQMDLDEAKSSTVAVQLDRELIARANFSSADAFGVATTLDSRSYVDRNIDPEWDGLSAVRSFINALPEQDEPIVLRTSYDLAVLDETFQLGADVQGNNIAITNTVLGEYMAYDDGTAEGTVINQPRTVTTQRYTAYVPDQLKGLRIRLPRGLNVLGDQPLRLVVYTGDTLPTERVYTEDVPIIYAETFGDSLQGYTTYLFEEPVELPVGDFFVGWEQVDPNRLIGIGYDRNTDARGFQFFDLGNNGEWQPLPTPAGALMVRPLLAGFSDPATSTDEAYDPTGLVDIYPNPTSDLLHLRPRQTTGNKGLNVTLFSVTGAVLQTQTGLVSLNVSDLPPGVYFLRISDGARWSRHKVIID